MMNVPRGERDTGGEHSHNSKAQGKCAEAEETNKIDSAELQSATNVSKSIQ